MNNLFNNNKTMWVLSIVVALLLWMYVINDQNPETYDNINDIPVELTNIETLEEKGLVISNSQEYTINIRVDGRRNQLYKINKNAIRVEADLSRLNSKGSHYLPVSIYGIPDDIEITRKNPDAIEIVLDQIVTQERNIKINITGNPAEGMASLSYVSNPTKATIEGAETILNSVSEVVAVIDITNATGEISRQLPLMAVDINGEEVKGVNISPRNVDVTIPIGLTKSVPVKTQINGDVPEDYVITNVVTNPTDIRIGGASAKLNVIDNISTESINVEGQTKSFEKKIKLLLPEGVEIINGEAAIMVKITIEPYVERTFETSNINITNLKEELVVQENIVDEPILITLKGIKNQIDEISEENISLYIDASDLQVGKHEVELKLDLPEGVILEGIEPNIVTINIQEKTDEVLE
jgi:YbbR domain-containing protein